MKLAKLIYNPVAGDATFKNKLDLICEKMQHYGWQIVPYRTSSREDIANSMADLHEHNYQAIFVSGGDGTIHLVINQLLKKGLEEIPLGIYPGGTANDLAMHFQLPKDIEKWCEIMGQGKIKKIDLGQANDIYFHNVMSAGLLTDVSYQVNYQLKNIFGKMAYYMKGMEKIPSFRPFHLSLESDEKNFAGDIMLCLILNGTSAGGFNQLAPYAHISDGKLEVLIVKKCSLKDLLRLFIQLRKGEHLTNNKVEYFQASKIALECSEPLITDVDGEKGPAFPLTVTIKKEKIKFFTN